MGCGRVSLGEELILWEGCAAMRGTGRLVRSYVVLAYVLYVCAAAQPHRQYNRMVYGLDAKVRAAEAAAAAGGGGSAVPSVDEVRACFNSI